MRRAQALLETTAPSVEQVATRAGVESAAALRNRFARVVGTGPAVYRRAFGAPRSVPEPARDGPFRDDRRRLLAC